MNKLVSFSESQFYYMFFGMFPSWHVTSHDLSNCVNGIDSYGHDASHIHSVKDIQDLREVSGLWLQLIGIRLAP